MSTSAPLFRATVLFGLLATVAFSGHALAPLLAHANPGSVTLFGRIVAPAGWGFTSSTVSSPGPDVTVQAGESFDPIINSGDLATHNWGVDYNGNGVIDAGEPLSNNTSASTSFTFTVTSTPGTYTYWCFIHKGPMHGRFIVLGPDFSIGAKPSSLTVNHGAWQESTLNVSSLNGFSGTVTLSPSAPSGITATLNSSMVTVAASSSKFVALNVTIGTSTTPGSYTVSVMASGGGNTHTADVSVTVIGPDFMISLDQTSLSMTRGSTGNVTVTLTSQNGFSGTVALTATVSPSGPTLSFTSTMLSLASGGSATSKLIVATTSASAGTYTVTVTGTGNPSLSHSATKSFTLTSPASPAAPIPTYVLIIAGVAILAAIVAVAIIVLRRPRK